jgi:hypothetical protein
VNNPSSEEVEQVEPLPEEVLQQAGPREVIKKSLGFLGKFTMKTLDFYREFTINI